MDKGWEKLRRTLAKITSETFSEELLNVKLYPYQKAQLKGAKPKCR